jgi:indolepyruvate ferredoxin oxidoreductase
MLADVSLDDKYTKDAGRVFMTGLQTLVRLPMLQRDRDKERGLKTAGYISGYRGSPLGGYDSALTKAKRHLDAHDIVFRPGINEDLAATAIWGTQQVNLYPGATVDGVFSIWYGKGPGVDRSADAIKHGNMAGTSPNGGVLLLVGDDHGAKSSTIAHQSDPTLIACGVPILNPASLAEYLSFGLFGFALSRFAGCWTALKAITEIVDSSAVVSIDPTRFAFTTPADPTPGRSRHIRIEEGKLEQERRAFVDRLEAVRRFARTNAVDKVVVSSAAPRLGIVTSGKSHLDFLRALEILGISAGELAGLGVSVYKVGLVWPLEPEGIRAFAGGLDELLVIEEKRGIIEDQIKALLFNAADAPRRVIGKSDERGAPLLPAHGELSPLLVAKALLARLPERAELAGGAARLAEREAIQREARGNVIPLSRNPFFCAGCPHNTSTKLPEGSRGMAGIGCHAMARWMDHLNTKTVTQMGGEGVNWIGHAPFTTEKHVFQNIGDGTYFHSGIVAIRASIAARSNITYKILYNDAVAMTGGQPVEGGLGPIDIVGQLRAEGAVRVVLLSEDPGRYPASVGGEPVRHRDDLIEVERELRVTEGVTALVFDQTCAAEKRRRRKQGSLPDPDRRVFINELVCEGCGDCSIQSHCVAVQPLDTELGLKRRIDQTACNKDISCLKGFCPSFVTVEGARLRRPKVTNAEALFSETPEASPIVPDRPHSIFVAGIGGTGVVTIGALLAMAAHLDGHGVTVLDVTGLAQKNGGVTTHVRIAASQDALSSPRIETAGADVVIACDLVVAVEPESLSLLDPERTTAVVNANITPTSSFVTNRDAVPDEVALLARLGSGLGAERIHHVTATALAEQLLGDAIGVNLFLVGFAWQRGLIPLSRQAIARAIELNGVAVNLNRAAFEWGRIAAHAPAAIEKALRELGGGRTDRAPRTLDELAAHRAAFLTAYQDAGYADRYVALVNLARAAETRVKPGGQYLAEAVARNFFKLMAYKDEYEVARLLTDASFDAALKRQFEGDLTLSYHLAPPVFARLDPTGRPRKIAFGKWFRPVLRLLARMKRLRGTGFDLFGRSEERRRERALRDDYESTLRRLLPALDAANYETVLALARLPEEIRGFGPVKAAAITQAEANRGELLATLERSAQSLAA